MSLLSQAGLDDAAILDAMTSVPARYWNLSFGNDAFLVLDRDPRRVVRAVFAPRAVHRSTRM